MGRGKKRETIIQSECSIRIFTVSKNNDPVIFSPTQWLENQVVFQLYYQIFGAPCSERFQGFYFVSLGTS